MTSFPGQIGAMTHSQFKLCQFFGKRFMALSIYFLLCFGTVKGQKIDSLKALISEKFGLERCDILTELAREYVDVDNKLTLRYSKEALNIARQIGDSLRIVKAARIKSLGYRRLEEMDSSMK